MVWKISKWLHFFLLSKPFLSVFLLKVHESCIASFPMESSLSDTCNQNDTRLHIIKRAENMWLAVFHKTFRGCPLVMNTSSVQQYIPMATETAVCQYFGTISPINVCNHYILQFMFLPFRWLIPRNPEECFTYNNYCTVCIDQISTTFYLMLIVKAPIDGTPFYFLAFLKTRPLRAMIK